MNTLIVYDEFGNVLFTQTGRNIPSLVGTAVMEVPAGKEVDRVNPETGEVILKDKEKTAGEQLETLKKAASITAAGFTDEQAAKVPDLYPAWEPAEAVQPGDRRSYGGKLYKAVQAHTTQADWTPDAVPALWAEVKA